LCCAGEIQAALAERSGEAPADRRIEFHIGIHQDDVVAEDGDIFGDGVNVAARLEGLAEPGGICVLFVLARNSSFSCKGQSPDVKQVGRELGVRYVLEGSVRKAGSRVRITAQLIDAVTGTHLWADRFDGSLEDIFELQDKVASSVARVIEPEVQVAETARSTGHPTDDLTACDLYLRAYTIVWSSRVRVPEALRLMEAGDRARSALRTRTRLGRALLLCGTS
jgi:TolB-like protein